MLYTLTIPQCHRCSGIQEAHGLMWAASFSVVVQTTTLHLRLTGQGRHMSHTRKVIIKARYTNIQVVAGGM